MGCNFYWYIDTDVALPTGATVRLGLPADTDVDWHIGKRSAAGPYCWYCDLTLCRDGNDRVHFNSEWWPACPRCGAAPRAETYQDSAAGVELGFAKPRDERPTGVASCASFSWAQEPDEVRRICEERLRAPLVVDEYDRQYTGAEFQRMLRANVAIEFRCIGERFT